MQEPSLASKLGAEFLGTFLLVFGGCGSVIVAGEFLSRNDVELGIGLLGLLRPSVWPCWSGRSLSATSRAATSTQRSASAWRSRSDSTGKAYCPTSSLRLSPLQLPAPAVGSRVW